MKSNKDLLMPGTLAMTTFLLIMLSSTVKPYGFFIDELYFMACAKRLAWGYIDQPPLSIALLALMQNTFGNSLMVVRILPALSISATVFVTGLIARRLGGSLISMLLAGFAVMIMPVFQIFGSFYSMNAYEPLIWTCTVYFLIRMIQENKPEYWVHIGILMGIGLQMKHTIILYAIALIFGLILSEKRRLLFSRWILWGGLACFVIILPNLIWQYLNGFPSLELYNNSFSSKNIEKPYLQVFIEQILFANPATLFLWISGLIALMLPKGKPYRCMFFSFLFLLTMQLISHSSRPDRIASIYTFFFAAGAVAVEQYVKYTWQRVIQMAIAIVLIAGGIILTPVFCPVLSPAGYKEYTSALGLKFSLEEGKKDEPVPQWLADRIGWRELAAEVADVYQALPDEERSNAVIVSTNYGEAGALEYFASEFGLPPVYATHNSYHAWGPPSDTVRTYLGVYVDIDDISRYFERVDQAGVYHCPDCTRPQQHVPVYIMRNPTISVEQEWVKFKHYQ